MSTVNELVVKFGLNTQGFEGGAARAEKSAENLTRSLERQAAMFGMPAREAKIAGLAMRGASEETIKAAMAADRNIAKLEEMQKSQRRAADITAAARTPQEVLNATLAEYDKMLVRGQITQETYNRSVAKAREGFARLNPAATASVGVLGRITSVGRMAAGSLSGIANTTGRLVRRIFSMQGAILAAVGGGGLAYMVTQSSKAIDETGKLADRLGDTTEGLTRQAHAALLAGVSGEQYAKNMEQFTKRLGEANRGTGEAKTTLDALGLSSDQLSKLAPTEAIKLVADRMTGLTSAADRAKAAQDLFGRGGLAMVNVMMQGSAAMAAAEQEADRLGLSYSRIEAAKVEAANDSFERAKQVLRGLANQVSIAVAPIIESLATSFVEAGTSGLTMGQRVSIGARFVIESIGRVMDMIDSAKNGYDGLRIIASKVYRSMADGIAKVAGLAANLPEWLGGGIAADISGIAGTFSQALSAEIAIIERQINERLGKPSNVETMTAAFDELTAKANAAAEATVAATKAATGGMSAEAIEQASKRADDAQKVMDRLRERLDGIGKTDLQKTIDQLRQIGTPQQVKDAELLAAKIREMEEAQQDRQDLERFAKGIIDDQITPMQKMQALQDRLQEALDAKLITQDQYTEALRRSREEMEGLNKAGGEGKQLSRFDFVPRMDAASALAKGGRNQPGVVPPAQPTDTMADGPIEVKGQDKVVATLGGIRGDLRSVLNSWDVA